MKTLPYLFKKPLKTLSLFSLLCFLLSTSMKCKKDNVNPTDHLPAATQTGANTFGCLVNGWAFTPTQNYIYNNSFNYGYNPAYGLSIEVINKDVDEYVGSIQINLPIANLTEGKAYTLTDYNIVGKGGAKYNRNYNTGQSPEYYETSNLVGGSLTVTKCDLVKKIISGVFSFKATNASNGNTTNVTDGRFDLMFK